MLLAVHNQDPGKPEVKDMKLVLPFNGIFITDRPGEQTVKPFDREIHIGDLRSRGELAVQVWTSDRFFRLDIEKFHLNHSNGTIQMENFHTVYGKIATVMEVATSPFLDECLSALVFFASICVVVYLVFSLFTPSPQPTVQPTTQPATRP